MRNLIKLLTIALATITLAGCEIDPAAMEAERRHPTLDTEMGGGMSHTGAGSDLGESTSGVDRGGAVYGGWKTDESRARSSRPGSTSAPTR